MNLKAIVTIALLAFVAVSVGYLVVTETRTADEAASLPGDDSAKPASAPVDETAAHKVIAYYFHSTQRCATCLEIERLAAETLKSEFAGALQQGELEWRVLNMEEPPNHHYVADYALVTSSLVIVDVHDGRPRAWVNMDRVWELVHDEEAAFEQYVADQVRAYLEL